MMEPVLTAAESARLDSESTIPVEVLMERAGRHVARLALALGVGYGSEVVVLAGPGNNGGDGYVAARFLRSRGIDVVVRALSEPRTEVAKKARRLAEADGVPVRGLGKPHEVDLVIDAVFGGGFRSGVTPELIPWMETEIPVLAVDIVSGLDPEDGIADEHVFTAELTVAFHTFKPGHLLGDGPEHSGQVEVVDIGLVGGDPILEVVTTGDAPRPPRKRRDHKWSVGSVLIVGGSTGMTGAAVLAARGALHFGAGAVGVLTPERETVAAAAPELLTYEPDQIDEVVAKYDVVAVGPGLDPASGLIGCVLDRADRVVADAGALDAAVEHPSRGELILTPHAGEFSRITDHPPIPRGAGELAAESGATVLLKGSPTVVAHHDTVPAVVRSGGPELATIGTGDVLTGMIGALWARGLPAHVAAMSAAYWHGIAAADLFRRRTVTADLLASHVGVFAHER